MNNSVNKMTAVTGADTPMFLYSKAEASGNKITGHLFLKGSNSEPDLRLSDVPGDYDSLAAVADEKAIYAAAGSYQDGLRNILFFNISNGKVHGAKTVTGSDKYDHIALCIHKDMLYLAVDACAGDHSDIRVFCLDPNGKIHRTFAATKKERAYRMERLVEIYQVRGAYEFDGGDFDPRKYGRDITPDHSVQHGLNLGYRFGFTSGGEHEGVGTTGVFARELTRDAIFDALYHRQVYGTTSIHLFATFFADESFMGSEIGTPPAFVTLHGVIRGTDDISAVIAVSNLGEIDLTPHYNPETGKYSTELSTDNMEWVYLRVKQADGNMAWMSPIFFGEEKQK